MQTDALPKPTPWEMRCDACGFWIVTVSGEAMWARGCCSNRRCSKYAKVQAQGRPAR